MARVRDAFGVGKRRPLLVLPTGAGKTVCFAWLVAKLQPTGQRVAIVAHRRELIRQASAKLGAVPHGIIAAGHRPTPHAIQVGSVQTMARRDLKPFDVLVIDEAHHAVSGQYEKLIAANPGARILGVTATPERLDGRGLGEVFDTLIEGPTVAELTAGGFLSPVRTFAPSKPPDIRAVATQAGDYMTRELAVVMDKPTITGDAVAHYVQHAAGWPAIAFCVSVQHAINTAEAFRSEGWRAAHVDGAMPEADRDRAIRGLSDGSVSVLTSCALIDEGLDIPNVRAVIDLCPTQSRGRFMQRVGRGMRPAPGKARLIHLDHAGNTFTHGAPDWPHVWTLDGTPRRNRTAPAVAQCPDCYALHSPAPRCPACGHDYETAAAARAAREAERVAGELSMLTLDDIRLAHLRTAPLRELVRGAVAWADLDAIREARGYHPGWTDRMAGYKHVRRGEPTGGGEFGG